MSYCYHLHAQYYLNLSTIDCYLHPTQYNFNCTDINDFVVTEVVIYSSYYTYIGTFVSFSVSMDSHKFKEMQQTDLVLLTWARMRGDNKTEFVISAAAKVTPTNVEDH